MKNGSWPSGVSAASVVPFDMDRAKEAVELDAGGPLNRSNQGLFIRRVSQ